eukprot:TRINITY_DN7306_c0_g1_i1.p1 TRINITY_DN7306_c0_g1~~TRINITY_DN7306_c0_g1_i1.p1  ORF type:complete len:786 (-),score=133.52 TRINITY_DN7306_c0_g1_i1:1058-3415(-)
MESLGGEATERAKSATSVRFKSRASPRPLSGSPRFSAHGAPRRVEEDSKTRVHYQSVIQSERLARERQFLLGNSEKTALDKYIDSSTNIRPISKSENPPSSREPQFHCMDPVLAIDGRFSGMDSRSRPISASSTSHRTDYTAPTIPTLRLGTRTTHDGISRSYLIGENMRPVSAREMHVKKYGETPRVVFGKVVTSEEPLKHGLQKIFTDLRPTDRKDVILLREALHEALKRVKDHTHNYENTKAIYMSCFNEIHRQVSIECQERGELLFDLWHGMLSIYEKSVDTAKATSTAQMGLARQVDIDPRDPVEVPKEEQNFQNLHLLDIIDSLRAQVTMLQDQLNEKDFDELEHARKVETKYKNHYEKLSHDCSLMQSYLKKIDELVDIVRGEYEAYIKIESEPKGVETHSFNQNIQIIKLLVENQQERIKESEAAIAKVQAECTRMQEDLKSMDNRLEDEKKIRERLSRQLGREREQKEKYEEQLKSMARETKEFMCLARPFLPDPKFELPTCWIAHLSPLATQLDPTAIELNVALTMLDEILSIIQPDTGHENQLLDPCRAAFKKRNPNAGFELIDQQIFNLLWTVTELRWMDDKAMLFSRLSQMFCPFKKDVIVFYCKSRDWLSEQTSTIIHYSEKQVPTLSIAGQVDYLDSFFPKASVIGKMLQLHQLSTISIPLNDRSSRMQQGPPYLPSKYAFPELSLTDPLNSTFGSSIELNRFLLYCLDEFDTPAWEGDDIITAVFQAANVTHDNELTFTMFRSVFKLVNADMSDAQVFIIYIFRLAAAL